MAGAEGVGRVEGGEGEEEAVRTLIVAGRITKRNGRVVESRVKTPGGWMDGLGVMWGEANRADLKESIARHPAGRRRKKG